MPYMHPAWAVIFTSLSGLCLVAGIVAACLKLRSAFTPAVLFLAAFSAMLLSDITFVFGGALWENVPDLAPSMFTAARFLHVAGLGLIAGAVFAMRGRGAGEAETPWKAAPGSPGTPSTWQSGRRPGWGLAGTWIGLSSAAFLMGLPVLVLVIDAGNSINDREMEGIALALGANFLFIIPSVIVYCVWLYTMWDSVPPEHRSTTPGKAVGFLFIPFFNLYWVFRAVAGLSASIDRALASRGLQAGGGFGIGLAACIIAVIPWVNSLAWPFFLIWVCLANAGRNRMLRILQQPPA